MSPQEFQELQHRLCALQNDLRGLLKEAEVALRERFFLFPAYIRVRGRTSLAWRKGPDGKWGLYTRSDNSNTRWESVLQAPISAQCDAIYVLADLYDNLCRGMQSQVQEAGDAYRVAEDFVAQFRKPKA